MVKKHKNRARRSATLHQPRTRIITNSRALIAKRVVIVVIVVALMSVVTALVCQLFFNEEKMTKRQLEAMAAEYYEDYIYENLVHGAMSQAEIEAKMEKYVSGGFAAVNLRQLLLYDNGKNIENGGLLQEHCDANTTSAKFYPEEPFDKKSYRIEYRYDCDF
ncbi:hypothetical protein IKG60_02185 [Candidatus Saccharibacteria bacterium]|nr:hypothetical protein [Candidatus Saccharibacteria bacterium]